MKKISFLLIIVIISGGCGLNQKYIENGDSFDDKQPIVPESENPP